MTDTDRYRGDGSADRERILNERDNAEGRAPQLTAEEVERRNVEIAREMVQRTIDGIRAGAEGFVKDMRVPNKERYYHAMWRAFLRLRGGNNIRDALIAAAALDGVQLKEEDEA